MLPEAQAVQVAQLVVHHHHHQHNMRRTSPPRPVHHSKGMAPAVVVYHPHHLPDQRNRMVNPATVNRNRRAHRPMGRLHRLRQTRMAEETAMRRYHRPHHLNSNTMVRLNLNHLRVTVTGTQVEEASRQQHLRHLLHTSITSITVVLHLPHFLVNLRKVDTANHNNSNTCIIISHRHLHRRRVNGEGIEH